MEARNEARRAVESRTAKRLARVGYAAKGILYATVGVLAAQLALGDGGAATDTRGALNKLAQVPFGKVLLWIVALGMFGLVLWRIAQAAFDAEGLGRGKKAAVRRVGLAVSGVIYAALMVGALRILLGKGSAGSGNATQDWTSKLMSMPFGQALVAVVGVIVAGFGIAEAIKGVRKKFERTLDLHGLAARHHTWVRRISTFGLVARGTVFCLMGAFLLYAAFTANPNHARGLGQTLGTIAHQPFGAMLLLIVALGLVAYAVFAFVEARYRRLPAH